VLILYGKSFRSYEIALSDFKNIYSLVSGIGFDAELLKQVNVG